MRQTLPVFIALCAVLIFAASCKRADKATHIPAPVFSTYIPNSPEDTSKMREIYYGLLTPVEVCNIFERLGLHYNDTAILATE